MMRMVVVAVVSATIGMFGMPVQAADGAAVGEVMLLAPALRTSDLDRSIKFYHVALGLVVGTTLHHGPVTEAILVADGPAHRPVVILLRDQTPGNAPTLDPGNGLAQIVLRVADLGAVVARMQAAGYPVSDIAPAVAGPRTLRIKDPDGYAYELVESAPNHG
jgi:catechol 2,3-dioxygenase-like lactoylglutathione lyase family enzyme